MQSRIMPLTMLDGTWQIMSSNLIDGMSVTDQNSVRAIRNYRPCGNIYGLKIIQARAVDQVAVSGKRQRGIQKQNICDFVGVQEYMGQAILKSAGRDAS